MSTYSSTKIFLMSFGGISTKPGNRLLLNWPSGRPEDTLGAVVDAALNVSGWDSVADVSASNPLLGVPVKVGRSESRAVSGMEPSRPIWIGRED